MPRLRRLGLAALLCAALPAAAGASTYSRVLRTYQVRGMIPPCLYTGAQLAAALKGVDVYGQQYFSDFTNAIQTALAQRAGGACVPGGAPGAGAPASVGGPALRLPRVTAATGADVPLPLLGIGALGLVALFVAAAAGVRRSLGLGAAGGGPWRHLWAEVAWRGAGGWEDFRAWLRLSRRAPRPRG